MLIWKWLVSKEIECPIGKPKDDLQKFRMSKLRILFN